MEAIKVGVDGLDGRLVLQRHCARFQHFRFWRFRLPRRADVGLRIALAMTAVKTERGYGADKESVSHGFTRAACWMQHRRKTRACGVRGVRTAQTAAFENATGPGLRLDSCRIL
ncbi:hypothetical protein GCM10009079_18910 [Ralstonia mannitolilytica]